MPNIALQVEYNGRAYHGFQRQKGLATIQGCLEHAISQVAHVPIQITCAGRTDAGVHATAQLINFHSSTERPLRAWAVGVNAYLPADIAIKKAWVMPENFHARFNAIRRTYRYIIYNQPLRHALWSTYMVHYPVVLNHEWMQQGANYLLGEHDFSAFRATDCQAQTASRCVYYCNVQRFQYYITIDIEANAFLQHMVRNIVGTLVVVGRGLHPPLWIRAVLASQDRKQAGVTMPAHGLYLTGVKYAYPFDFINSLHLPHLF